MPEKDKVCWIKAAQEEEEQFRVNYLTLYIVDTSILLKRFMT